MSVEIKYACTLLDVVEAGEVLGVSRRRVTRLIADPCPACDGAGQVPYEEGAEVTVPCSGCRGNGRRLPAVQIGNSWAVFDWGLDLAWNRDRSTGVKLEAVNV